jgi:hypothetical protein
MIMGLGFPAVRNRCFGAGALAVVLGFLAAACDGGTDGGEGDADAPDDATLDVGVEDAPGDVPPEVDAEDAPGDVPLDVDAEDADPPEGETDSGEPEWPVLPTCIFSFIGEEEIDHELLSGSAAGGVSYRLWRCMTGQGSGHTGVYRADAFELVFGGRTYRVDAAGNLVYSWTHHNWEDTLVATHPEAILHWRVEAELIGPFELRTFVSATDATDGTTLLPETRVE